MDYIRPKKSLGQNFLTSEKAVSEIVLAGDIKDNDTVIEIGPGKGALTEKLLEKNIKLIAIEKDDRLIEFLNQKFQEEIANGKFKLLSEDVLNIDIDSLLSINKIENYKLIANIPYYITGAIIEKFQSLINKPKIIVVLVQKEVAERVVAKDGKESILSLATKFYGQAKIVYKVSAGSFFPKPKVDSAVLKITLDENLDSKIEKTYLKIVKSALSHKRKIMKSNLKNDFKEYDWDKIFESLNFDPKARGEDFTKEDFVKLSKHFDDIINRLR